jgi:hypothetical protein
MNGSRRTRTSISTSARDRPATAWCSTPVSRLNTSRGPTLAALWRQYRRYGFWEGADAPKNVRALHPRQVPPIALLPWLVVSGASALVMPNVFTLSAAVVWPAMVTGAAALVAARRRVSPLQALRALVAVHVAWTVGFWHGVLVRHVREGA